MNASRNIGTALLLGLVGALVGAALLLVFVLPGASVNNASSGQEERQATGEQTTGERTEEAVSRERAEEIAVEHLGEGEVTWIGREDDHGAAWEIEVTAPDGAETNVYVAADGTVTHVAGRGNDPGNEPNDESNNEPAPEPAPEQPQTITAQRAGEIAAAHVGGTVDEVYPESDYGAAWDVDVYSPEGEYTVYVSATGEVVRVEGPYED